tara:strand:+ start:458 stop:1345 length:888 start_codon:yes stop_codon:yes gene_type:complete
LTELDNKNITKTETSIWDYAKSLSLVVVVVAISIKLCSSDMELKMDVPTFLSIALALFSVGLSAIFYFKATDTSNKFYDNSYRYTKDVAQLLVKIESGFGERLKKLDEGYLSMKEEIQKMPTYSVKGEDSLKLEIERTKKELKFEKDELNKIKKDQNLLVKHTVENSQLHENEKNDILQKLTEKEEEAEEAQQQVLKLNKRLFAERLNRKKINSEIDPKLIYRVKNFTRDSFISYILDLDIPDTSFVAIEKAFQKRKGSFPNRYLDDMLILGYLTEDKQLTKSGLTFLKKMLREA